MPVAENNVYKFIYDSCIHVYMAKLYWRIKTESGWTWTPATIDAWTPESIMLLKESQTDKDGVNLFTEEEE